MAPSLEYAVGQIWRTSQPDLRLLFHETGGGHATRIDVDHGLKRITFSPPLS